MSDELLIEVNNLVKTFDGVPAVNGLDLQVRAGEMVGLVGPDGAGKTTAMRLLCGALHPTSGAMRVAGYPIPEQVEKAREDIGYLAQRFSLYGDLTVKENLDFFGEVFDMDNAEREQRSKELLRFAGLEEFANRPAVAKPSVIPSNAATAILYPGSALISVAAMVRLLPAVTVWGIVTVKSEPILYSFTAGAVACRPMHSDETKAAARTKLNIFFTELPPFFGIGIEWGKITLY
jgi:hypothetical protein